MVKVAIFVVPGGSEDSELVVPADVFVRAGYEVDVISLGEKIEPAKLGWKVKLEPEKLLSDLSDSDLLSYDVLMIPGGDVLAGFEKNGNRVKWVYQEKNKDLNSSTKLTAICAAPYLLGQWGILNNKNYTCFPGIEQQILAPGAKYTAEQTTTDGNIITGHGPGAAFDFAFEIVKSVSGEERAKDLAQNMCYILK
ncbi:MAG: DJ-1/PfpI family protein [Candidatus Ancillula sp.]|jgi:4-methyl-5(b-hydroxyethyl)-thiazole monophosphate biosynthesis|nr:DJ-1/PfpI family protein [Candidatus Ancillula sp.]